MPEQIRIIIMCIALKKYSFYIKYNKLHRNFSPYTFFILISVVVISPKVNLSSTIVML